MKLANLYKSKLGLFTIQIFILTLFDVFANYKFPIEFDSNILAERQFVIQFLANYVMYEFDISLFFQYGIWILVGLIPAIVLKDTKRVVVLNLTTFFFPNYFLYVFLSKYSPMYFTNFGGTLFLKTLIFALLITLFSFVSTIIIKLVKALKPEVSEHDLSIIEEQVKSKCPYCGTEFNSIPIYCYKCNKRIMPYLEDEDGQK